MSPAQKRSLRRRVHAWLGWVLALLLTLTGLTGIALQHPEWLGTPGNEPLAVAVDPTDPARMLRGTHWGVEVSTDGGIHWRELSMLAPPTDVGRILFLQGAPGDGLVYALGSDALVTSSDGGRVWREVDLPSDERLLGAQLRDISVSTIGELNLLTSVGLFRRTAGEDWQAVGDIAPPSRDLRTLVHDLHTGHLAGAVGRRVAEGGAWGLLVLIATGLLLRRRQARKANP